MKNYHITVNGVPECQAPIYQMHKSAGNSARVMSDSATSCGYGGGREEAERDAAKLRIAFPGADIKVEEGLCHEDPWWKTEAGKAAIEIEQYLHQYETCTSTGPQRLNPDPEDNALEASTLLNWAFALGFVNPEAR